MEEKPPTQTEPPPKESGLKFLWLLAAFVPSVAGIVCLNMRPVPQHLLTFILLASFFSSFVCSFRLLSHMKDKTHQSLCAALLGVFFFGLNIVIALFVGCSGMGRIAP